MKKFSVPCNFNGQMAPFTIYIGMPKDGNHPLHFQADWLSKERGGTIPQEVMDSIQKLKDLADKNNVSFEDLCVYALGAAQQEGAEDEGSNEGEGDAGNSNYQDYGEDEHYDDNSADDQDGVKVATAKIPADQAKQG